jgi:hypothetical protein
LPSSIASSSAFPLLGSMQDFTNKARDMIGPYSVGD